MTDITASFPQVTPRSAEKWRRLRAGAKTAGGALLRAGVALSRPTLQQFAGGVATFSGVYLAWGLAVTLLTGGPVIAALGALRESGRI